MEREGRALARAHGQRDGASGLLGGVLHGRAEGHHRALAHAARRVLQGCAGHQGLAAGQALARAATEPARGGRQVQLAVAGLVIYHGVHEQARAQQEPAGNGAHGGLSVEVEYQPAHQGRVLVVGRAGQRVNVGHQPGAQRVINNSGKKLWPNYGDNFNVDTENGQESLFEAQYTSGLNQYTLDGPGSVLNEFWGARFYGSPYVVSSGGYGFNIPEKELVDGYEAGDKRKAGPVFAPGDLYTNGPRDASGKVQVQPDPKVQPLEGDPNNFNVRKFYVGVLSTIWDSPLNVPILHLSEMYLIVAEAAGPTADGLAGINLVRTRAGLPAPTAFTKSDVLRERRYEFAFEMDHWYDLKRTGMLTNPGLMAKDIKPFNGVLPIPQAEIDVNPNLKQNPGY